MMPDMNRKMLESEGYKKLLDVLEVLEPGSRDKMIDHAKQGKRSMH